MFELNAGREFPLRPYQHVNVSLYSLAGKFVGDFITADGTVTINKTSVNQVPMLSNGIPEILME